jgi:hypothetical protein
MLALLASIFTATAMATTTPIIQPPATINLETVPEVRVEPQAELTEDISKKIIQVFGEDSNIALRIAKCESGLRQFENGKVLRGIQNSQDIGVFQINEYYHLAESQKLGKEFYLYATQGNINYAKYLFDQQGTKPWSWSKDCWQSEAPQ